MTRVEKYGPWAVIAGASAGLGAAFAEEAARNGVHLVTVARRSELLEARAAELRTKYGVHVRPLVADLGAPDLAERIRPALRDLEVGLLVHNATLAPAGRFFEVPVAEHLACIAVNCNGATILAHELGAKMRARGRGGMVFLSSMGALQGAGVFASYFAAKAWDWICGEGLWAELQGTGVDVVSYAIGATQGDNFHLDEIRNRPAVIGEEPSLQDALDRVRNPVTADFVARQLFDILPKGPTVYPNEAEAKTAERVFASPRRDAVLAMNKLTTLNWG